jgi:hypothetical protein
VRVTNRSTFVTGWILARPVVMHMEVDVRHYLRPNRRWVRVPPADAERDGGLTAFPASPPGAALWRGCSAGDAAAFEALLARLDIALACGWLRA